MMYVRQKESDPRRNVLYERMEKEQGSAKCENDS